MRKLLTSFILICFLTPITSQAGANQPVMFKGVDISAAIAFYSKQVSVLTSSVSIYNWSEDPNDDDSSQSQRAQLWAKTFWSQYGSAKNGTENTYGNGLYAALDPVVTTAYGGIESTGWLLLEMKLPVGFRFLDLRALQAVPSNVQTILTKFNCDSVDAGFAHGGFDVDKNCQGLIRTLFKDQIKIDGFAYAYGSWTFDGCVNDDYESYRAFVITGSDWMRPELINYYTVKTTKNRANRTMIQSLFLNAPSANPEAQEEITLQEVLTLVKSGIVFRKSLLWSDLEGTKKASAKSQIDWLKSHKYGCSGKLPIKSRSN